MFAFLSLLAIQHAGSLTVIFFAYSSKSLEDSDSFIESELEEPHVGKQDKTCRIKSNNKQKTERKPRWSQAVLDDFIDIIVSSDQYKKKLIFQNEKCQQNADIYGKIREELKKRSTSRGENLFFTVDQLRSKFKKCVSERIKTGTGIKKIPRR